MQRELMGYHWPGNVRELENMIKRMVVSWATSTPCCRRSRAIASPRCRSEESRPTSSIDLAALGADFSSSDGLDLKAISKRAAQIAEKKVIERVLTQTRWNRKEAAERLQISYKALALQDEGERAQRRADSCLRVVSNSGGSNLHWFNLRQCEIDEGYRLSRRRSPVLIGAGVGACAKPGRRRIRR